jgi:malate dehydrogenase
MVKVCVCGGAGGIGQPLSMLMAMEPLVTELCIFDLNIAMVPSAGVAADLSHLERNCKVTGYAMEVGKKPIDHMKECLDGCKLVLIPAGMPRKPGMTRADLLNTNADIAKGLVEACAKYCPTAVVALIVNPVNSVVPAMTALWEKAGLDPRKVVGITTLDVVRANKFVAEKCGVDVKSVDVTVIGGHAGTTILPLFSQDAAGGKIPEADIPEMDKKVQDAGTVVVEAKGGKGSATLSMAYAGARLGVAIVKGLSGESPVECAYTKSTVCAGLPYFASKVKFGPEGVQEVLPYGTLSAYEEKRLAELTPTLKEEIEAGLKYAEGTSFDI